MLSQASIKTWYQVHKWTSLVCTAFMLLLCITGLPLIFSHEIDHALGHSAAPRPMPGVSARVSVDEIVADARARRPQEAVQFLFSDPDEPELWHLRLGETVEAEEPSSLFTYDARTGEFLGEYPLGEGLMHVLFRLHVDLFAGLPGMLFLGAMGLLLVASLVSGAVLYGPFMRQLSFGTVRRGRSVRLKWLDLHNLLGIVTLVWFLVVGATGVINTLAIPIFGQWKATELAQMTAPYRDGAPRQDPGSAQKALEAARAAAPGMELSFLAFPGNGFASPHHYMAYMRGGTAWSSTLLEPVLIDAATGEVAARGRLPWYVQALLVSQPLHFGDYGGLPLKILWALLDLASIVVLGSGLYLWLKRRRVPIEARLQALERQGGGEAPPAPAVGREGAA